MEVRREILVGFSNALRAFAEQVAEECPCDSDSSVVLNTARGDQIRSLVLSPCWHNLGGGTAKYR